MSAKGLAEDDATPSPKDAARRTVLVVEDDSAIRDALVEALTDQGLEVDSAEDGAQALQSMTKQLPALVLLDLMMPRMTGWQVIEEMHKQPALKGIPVVVLTAARNVGSVPPGYPVFVKPLRLERLVRSIEAFLR